MLGTRPHRGRCGRWCSSCDSPDSCRRGSASISIWCSPVCWVSSSSICDGSYGTVRSLSRTPCCSHRRFHRRMRRCWRCRRLSRWVGTGRVRCVILRGRIQGPCGIPRTRSTRSGFPCPCGIPCRSWESRGGCLVRAGGSPHSSAPSLL